MKYVVASRLRSEYRIQWRNSLKSFMRLLGGANWRKEGVMVAVLAEDGLVGSVLLQNLNTLPIDALAYSI